MARPAPDRIIERLLRQDERELKAYLTLRLGSPELLEESYRAVREALARESVHGQDDAPSLRAVAYAAARTEARKRGGNDARDRLQWQPPEGAGTADYATTLDTIRRELVGADSELLELRHARNLSLEEVAFVLGHPVSQVERSLAAARQRVEPWVSPLDGVADPFEQALRDALSPRLEIADGEHNAQSPTFPRGQRIGGRFEIQSQGVVGQVVTSYAALDESVSGRTVTLQVFQQPARTLAARGGLERKLHQLEAASGPHVEHVVAYGWHGDRLWRALRRPDGGTLDRLLAKGRLEKQEVVDLLEPLARALGDLHERGIVHGSVSPACVALHQGGGHKTDFLWTGTENWIAGALRTHDPFDDVRALAVLGVGALGEAAASDRKTGAPSLPRGPLGRALAPALTTTTESPERAYDLAKRLARIRGELDARARRTRWLAVSATVIGITLLLVGFAYYLTESRARLLRRTLDVADTATLEEDLEAEQARSLELERELERRTEAEHSAD